MIVINAIIKSTAEDIAAMQEAIAAMEAASRKESGCLDYTFSVELNDPDSLRITECWEDADSLQAHFATEHMKAFNGAMAAHPPKDVGLRCYQADEIPLPRGD